MPFFDTLLSRTAESRETLVRTPIIQDCLRGNVTLPAYIAFLREAYHHVRHTVPLMQACRARMPARLAWILDAIDEYIEEETGHDEWILNDLRVLGQDAETVRRAGPGAETEIMVAYAYDTIARKNPMGFFGMVHVLEGTSVALALNAADGIQAALGLPTAAFSYLRSHGTLDREHTAHFAALMNRLDEPDDQFAVVHAANMFYRLYGAIFRALPRTCAGDADQ
jgi:pyrroloquinoline quinone (PQQ) biosynthesis protein C